MRSAAPSTHACANGNRDARCGAPALVGHIFCDACRRAYGGLDLRRADGASRVEDGGTGDDGSSDVSKKS